MEGIFSSGLSPKIQDRGNVPPVANESLDFLKEKGKVPLSQSLIQMPHCGALHSLPMESRVCDRAADTESVGYGGERQTFLMNCEGWHLRKPVLGPVSGVGLIGIILMANKLWNCNATQILVFGKWKSNFVFLEDGL